MTTVHAATATQKTVDGPSNKVIFTILFHCLNDKAEVLCLLSFFLRKILIYVCQNLGGYSPFTDGPDI